MVPASYDGDASKEKSEVVAACPAAALKLIRQVVWSKVRPENLRDQFRSPRKAGIKENIVVKLYNIFLIKNVNAIIG
jgi:hypothetical protein